MKNQDIEIQGKGLPATLAELGLTADQIGIDTSGKGNAEVKSFTIIGTTGDTNASRDHLKLCITISGSRDLTRVTGKDEHGDEEFVELHGRDVPQHVVATIFWRDAEGKLCGGQSRGHLSIRSENEEASFMAAKDLADTAFARLKADDEPLDDILGDICRACNWRPRKLAA